MRLGDDGVYVEALRAIALGEELLVDYSDEYCLSEPGVEHRTSIQQ